MPIMNAADRRRVHRELMRDISRVNDVCAVTKPDLLAAVVAADQWLSDNTASYNGALPQ